MYRSILVDQAFLFTFSFADNAAEPLSCVFVLIAGSVSDYLLVTPVSVVIEV